MKREEFKFRSADGKNKCHAYLWTPEDREVRAVLQIVHGMVEYGERYEDFARFLTGHGFAVACEDHLGHGKTAATAEDLGYFAEENAPGILVKNVYRLRKIMTEKFPDVPYFMLGHSMGSFIFRRYLTVHGEGLAGAVIMGTGFQSGALTLPALALSGTIGLFKGDRYRSAVIQKLAFGGYNKKIAEPHTENAWLTRDDEIVDRYNADPFCTFRFTINGYQTLFRLVRSACDVRRFALIPKTLPVLIVSGDSDPVGDYGKAPKKLCRLYREAGIRDVSLKLYRGGRHEILNETNRSEVYADLLGWMEKKI